MIISTKTLKIIKFIVTPILFGLSIIFTNISNVSAASFYKGENKYKGFYWFESNQSLYNKAKDQEFHYPSPEEAVTAIEARKKALDDARSQMVELAFLEDTPPLILRQAIVKYKKLEASMYDGAIRLTQANEMANFTNPEIAGLTEQPTNVFGNKIKRTLDQAEKIVKIREFAQEFDLLVFTNNNCPYSKAFEPVITNFASAHSFSLDKTSLDSLEGKIAQKLGITSTPSLVAIRKDAKEIFEISRGMVSVSELESRIILSSKYSKEQKSQSLKNTKYNR